METDGIRDRLLKLLIPSKHASKIIFSLRDIASQARGARIKVVNDRKSDYEDTVVSVEGNLSAKQDSSIILFKHLEKQIDSPRRKSPSPRKDRRYRERDQSSMIVSVPDDFVARLIGRKGETVKNMMDLSGCSITFHKQLEGIKTPEGDNARLCTLKGSINSITSAVRVLLENVNKLERD